MSASAGTPVRKQTGLASYPEKGVITGTTTKTGTISIPSGSRFVTGVGTLFTSELQVGDYIYATDSGTYGEVRKVVSIESDLNCGIESAFSSVISGISLVRARDGVARSIIIIESGNGTAVSYVNLTPVVIGSTEAYNDLITPVCYDASAADAQLTVVYIK